MMRRWFSLSLLAVAVASPAHAAEVRVFSLQSSKAFLEGTLDGVSVDANGVLSLAEKTERVAAIGEPFAFCFAALPDGWAVGTGNEGRILKVSATGGVEVLFDAEEPVVFALWADPDGTLFAGTSPEGKVYRIRSGRAETLFDPGETYIWDIVRGGDGALWIATGTEGRLYRVDDEGRGEIAFDSEETHLRSLLALPGGDLLVGTAPAGLVLRWSSSKGSARTVYDSALSEVVAFAPAGAGAAWAAVLASESSLLDAAPRKAPAESSKDEDAEGDSSAESPSVVVVVETDAKSAVGSRPAGATGPRSELVRILPTGVVEPLWTSTDETIFSLHSSGQRLWMGTGLEGKLYRFDRDRPRVEKDLEERQIVDLVGGGAQGPALLTTNAAAIWRFSGGSEKRGSFTSAALDAGQVARFGVFRRFGEIPRGSAVRVSFRSGSSAEPDRTWSSWSEPSEAEEVPLSSLPGGRYVQFRLDLEGSDGALPKITSTELSYRQENLRPKIERLWSLDPGQILVPTGFNPGEQVFEPASPNREGIFTTLEPAMPRDDRFKTVWKRGWRTLRWKASDPNGDDLRYALDVRREGTEGPWVEMVEDLDASHWSFDATVLPDGRYRFRLRTDDGTDNDGSALEATEISEPVLVDHTPPELRSVRRSAGGLRIEVYDAASPLREARLSVDGKEWKPVGVADGMLDGRTEVLIVEESSDEAGMTLLRLSDAAFNVRTFDLRRELER